MRGGGRTESWGLARDGLGTNSGQPLPSQQRRPEERAVLLELSGSPGKGINALTFFPPAIPTLPALFPSCACHLLNPTGSQRAKSQAMQPIDISLLKHRASWRLDREKMETLYLQGPMAGKG